MDNPISWGVLVVLALCLAVWFAIKCQNELDQHWQENEDFFAERERRKDKKFRE